MKRSPERLGTRLVRAGYISQEQLEQSLQFQKQEGTLLGETLVRHGFLTKEQLSRFLYSDPGASIGEILIGEGYLTLFVVAFTFVRALQMHDCKDADAGFFDQRTECGHKHVDCFAFPFVR